MNFFLSGHRLNTLHFINLALNPERKVWSINAEAFLVRQGILVCICVCVFVCDNMVTNEKVQRVGWVVDTLCGVFVVEKCDARQTLSWCVSS